MNSDERNKMVIPRWVTQINYDEKQVEKIKNNLVEYPGFEVITNDEISGEWESSLPFLFNDNQKVEDRWLLLYNGIPVIPGPKLNAFMDWYYEESGYPIGGRDFMYDIIKDLYIGVSRRDIERYIKSRMKEKKFVLKRRVDDLNPLVANRPMQIWEIKILDMDYAQYNPGLTASNYPYLVLVKDNFTQFIWANPLLRKDIIDQVCKFLSSIYKDIEGTESIGTVFGTRPLIIKTNKMNHKNTLLTSLKFSQCLNGVRVEMKGGDHKVPDLPNNLDKNQVIHLIGHNDKGNEWEKRITRLIENELAGNPIIDSYDEIIQKVINDYNDEMHDVTKVSPYDAYNKETWYTIKENIYDRVKKQTQKTLDTVKEKREKEFKAKSLTLEEEMNERINQKQKNKDKESKSQKVKVIDLNSSSSNNNNQKVINENETMIVNEIDEFA